MYDTELHYLSRTEMHSDDKWYVEKYKLYLNLVWLLAEIGGSGGDVMGGAGYRPTNAAVAVFKDRFGAARGGPQGLRQADAGGRGVQQDPRDGDHRPDVIAHSPRAMCFLTLPVTLSDCQIASPTRYAVSVRESADHWMDPS